MSISSSSTNLYLDGVLPAIRWNLNQVPTVTLPRLGPENPTHARGQNLRGSSR